MDIEVAQAQYTAHCLPLNSQLEEANSKFLLNLQRINHDSAWKDILEYYFFEFIQYFYPDLKDYIDWEQGYISLDKELNTIDLAIENNKRIVDKLIKIKSLGGEEQWVFIHVEIQHQPQLQFEQRMFEYYYRLYECFKKPIISLAILADGQLSWRPQCYQSHVWGKNILQFNFFPVKLLDYRNGHPELETNHLFNIILDAHFASRVTRKDMVQRFDHKLQLAKRLYAAGFDKEKIQIAYKFIDWILTLPADLNFQYYQQLSQLKEEQTMGYITSIERMGMEKGFKQGLYQGAQQGLEQGIQEGMQKGIQEGMQKGIQEGEYKLLQSLLELKFKNIPQHYCDQLMHADADTLLRWGERILTATTLEEIFI